MLTRRIPGLIALALILTSALPSVAQAAEPRVPRATPRVQPPVDFPALAAGDILGGDDVLIMANEDAWNAPIDIAANGDIYVATEFFHPTDGPAIRVFRSTDGGATFPMWGEITYPAEFEWINSVSLVVAEGVVERCHVAYTLYDNSNPSTRSIVVASEDLSATEATFGDRSTAMTIDGFANAARLVADDDSFSEYYLYLVAHTDLQSYFIWYSASYDQGSSWDPAYQIAQIGTLYGSFKNPVVSHGFGSHVHVAWEYQPSDTSLDAAIFYRRAANDGINGLSDWGPAVAVTSAENGLDEVRPRIEAAHDANTVVLAYSRESSAGMQTPVARVANDQGNGNFVASPTIELWPEPIPLQDLARSPASGRFAASLGHYESVIVTASAAAPSTWTEHGTFRREGDPQGSPFGSGALAFDPTHGDRLGQAGLPIFPTGRELVFDAEWFADPGHPIQRDGFPRGLTAAPASDPALVDLDGDGNLEIVFGDAAGHVHAIQADGSDLPGWPVNVGSLSSSPIAVGQLTMSDAPYVVAGTTDGFAHALRPDGSIAPGWPFDTETGAPVHVSIGALGGPFPRTIVLASGDAVMFRDHANRWAQGSFMFQNIGHVAVQPCAIGDVDGDGIAEVVSVWDTQVAAFKRDTPGSLFQVGLLENISGPVTLGDVDLDGDLEVAVPLADGTMHLLDQTGAAMPGWPFASTVGSPLSGAAWADVLASGVPELAFASSAWKVHLVRGDGTQVDGFPARPSIGWFLEASPIIEQIDGLFPDIGIGTRGSQGWAFNVVGGTIEGWPRDLGAPCERVPAVADLDQDGYNEIVMLTNDDVQVFNLRTEPFGPEYAWPMAGHDPQRTGCSDCAEDLATAVDDPTSTAPTIVSFAPPHPNPATNHTVFSFAVPASAVVALDILDLRGRRIRTVERHEVAAGQHVLGWDGRDQQQRPVAAGVYYARLRVRGPGVDETVTRKVTMLR